MNKKILRIVIVLILVILLFPYRINFLKDGGSKHFQSLTYEITKVHKMTDDRYSDGIIYMDGLIIKILGFEIYNSLK